MTRKLRSSCPINFCLELFGDPWSLMIIRDAAFNGKSTYGEFLSSAESISTKVLAARLDRLVKAEILEKRRDPSSGRVYLYSLTGKGKKLIPLLHEMIIWGAENGDPNPELLAWAEAIRRNPGEAYRAALREQENLDR